MDFWGGGQCFVWGWHGGRRFFFEERPKEEICGSQHAPVAASFGERRPDGRAGTCLAVRTDCDRGSIKGSVEVSVRGLYL